MTSILSAINHNNYNVYPPWSNFTQQKILHYKTNTIICSKVKYNVYDVKDPQVNYI